MWRKGEKRGRRVSDSGRERAKEREREGERAPVSWEVQTAGGGGGGAVVICSDLQGWP